MHHVAALIICGQRPSSNGGLARFHTISFVFSEGEGAVFAVRLPIFSSFSKIGGTSGAFHCSFFFIVAMTVVSSQQNLADSFLGK